MNRLVLKRTINFAYFVINVIRRCTLNSNRNIMFATEKVIDDKKLRILSLGLRGFTSFFFPQVEED